MMRRKELLTILDNLNYRLVFAVLAGYLVIAAIIIGIFDGKVGKPEKEKEVVATPMDAVTEEPTTEENDGIYLELDSARRSVAAQQDIMDRFTEQYGADYAAKTVAAPGFSEHHTGLALDLYFRRKGDDGKFTDVYYNEDLVQYPEVWEKIHAKLAGYGFILRYPEGEEQITGYSYEPWHIRYLDNAEIAKEITEEGLTLEEYLSGTKTPDGQRAEKTV